MSEEECICQGKCPGVMSEKSTDEPPEDGFCLEDVPELVLKKILEKIPRRNGFQKSFFVGELKRRCNV